MLPTIPAKRYFTIGEVAELCEVKPHVLRYWEQEFTQLRPIKRRGNRRYYQHHEVLMIRRIRDLLYGQGFTINGARNRLQESADEQRSRPARPSAMTDADGLESTSPTVPMTGAVRTLAEELPEVQLTRATAAGADPPYARAVDRPFDYAALRRELLQLRALLCDVPAAVGRSLRP